MSRKTIFQNDRFTLVGGDDHMLGKFVQLYDKEMVNETPEGEGLVFDWSEKFGVEVNYTGIPANGEVPVEMILIQYLQEHDIDLVSILLNPEDN